jgi:hypothetical protein
LVRAVPYAWRQHTQRSNHAALLEAQADIPFMGHAIDIDPAEALLSAVQITAGQAAYAGQRVAALGEADKEALHSGWVTFHGQLIERLARYSAMAISAGVAERLVAQAEQLGDALGAMLKGVFDEIALTPELHCMTQPRTLDIQKDNHRVTEHLERVKRWTT